MILARGPEKPDGDVDEWLTFLLGMTQQGQIDLESYHRAPAPWLATWGTARGAVRTLEVIRLDEGWALQSVDHEDDPICTFDGHVFRPGEVVRVRQPGGHVLLFRIVAVESVDDERPDQALSV